MADTTKKQFLDSAGLSQLVANIKSEDAKTLQSAKDYADSLSDQYDVAGAASTAEENAKSYTDELANGQVKANTDAIAVLNGDESVDGSVAKDIKDAINAFATEISENGTIDTFKELVDYVAEHGGEAAEMASAIETLETLVGEKSVATQIAEAIAAENLDQYATDEELAEAIARIVVLEGKVSTWDSAEQNAKDYADGLNTAMDTRVKSLEADNTTNKGDISTMKGQISALEAGTYDDTEVRGLITTNAEDIDKLEESLAEGGDTANAISDAKKAGTDAQADVDALEEKVGEVAEGKTVVQMIADAQTAATYDDTDVKADIEDNATAIAALEEKVGDGWDIISEDDINAMFSE